MKILSLKEKKELKEILPDFNEEKFIKEAVKAKIKVLKGAEFFMISEKIKKGLVKKGLLAKTLVDFKD